ncbi:lipid storage droplets surface-binding protein 1-like [Halictus rubicundus]|uniref:lipid storage droplets surface-binding protein 1-like n=1 Tax=Halictus rubicundus TaxID=77578 RepID=UPI00403589C5
MSAQTVRRRHSDLPHVESLSRILKLPIVEDGTQIAGIVYSKIKRSNSLMNWGLGTAERSFMVATTLATPAINVFNGPISAIDHLLCKGIDVVEEKVPAVHLPPSQIYSSAKDYMASKIKPVLTRAESMTQIGSFVANATAERLNDALTNLEKRIDHYLPADPVDEVDYPNTTKNISKTKLTVIHGVRCSRKLQRGLTRQTIAETRALMRLGQTFADVIKLVLTDPMMAMQQATSMWKALSLPEPENQVRPSTVEESLVLLLREISRWFVHAVNNVVAFVRASLKLNDDVFEIFHLWVETINSLRYYMVYSIIKFFVDEANNDPTTDHAKNPIQWLSETIQKILTRIAMIIAGNPDVFKSVQDLSPQQNHNNHVSQPEREKKSSEREINSSEKERNSSEKERKSQERDTEYYRE